MAPRTIKTSVALEPATLDAIKRIAARDSRSVSYLIQKVCEAIVEADETSTSRLAEDSPDYAKRPRRSGAQGSVDGGVPVQVADPRTSETCTKSRHPKKAQS